VLQELENPGEGAVCECVELLWVEELNGVRDEDHAQVGHPEQASLLERLVRERDGADACGRDAAPFEPYQVVHTARHARSSVG
jgi:hypothetical protein